jgi:hypothetical protein
MFGMLIQLLPPESPFRRHSEDLSRSFQRFKISLSAPSTPASPPSSAFARLNDNADSADNFDNDDTTFVYDALPPRLQAQWSVWKQHLESLPTVTALLQRTLEEARLKVSNFGFRPGLFDAILTVSTRPLRPPSLLARLE